MEVKHWVVQISVHVCTYCVLAVLLGSFEYSYYLSGASAQLTDGARANSCGSPSLFERHDHAAYLGETLSKEDERKTDGRSCRRLEGSLSNTQPLPTQNEAILTHKESKQSEDVTQSKGDTVQNVEVSKKKDFVKKKYKGSKKQRKKDKKKKMGKRKKRG